MGWTTILAGSALVLGGIVCGTVYLYKMSQPRPLPCPSKIVLQPKKPLPPVIEEKKIPENVVAIVGGEMITIEEVQEFVNEIPQLKEVPFEQIYPKMLDLLINNKIIALGARETGITRHPEIKRMLQLTREQIITQAYLSQLLDKAVTNKDLENLYAEQVKAFEPKDEIHARHILLGSEDQAKDTLIQLQAGADFATLANQKSLDKNAPNGDLGYFTKDMMIPEFGDAVFSMKKGQLSGPVKTAYGWHIIQVEDVRKTQPPSFESQKDMLRQKAMERKLPQILQQERKRRSVQIIRPTVDAQ
jgi:peptidyl-prolyl cis-trans isomerase C